MYSIFIAVILLLLVDLYFFQAVKTLFKNFSFPFTAIVYVFYWAVTAAGFAFAITYRILPEDGPFKSVKLYGLSILLIFSFCKLLGILPLIADDFTRLIKWSVSLWSVKVKHSGGEAISRSKFLSQLAFVIAAIPFAAFLYGMIKGAFNYQVRTSRLILPDLPPSFKGIKIVQISDLHLGSFISLSPVKKAVDIIKAQNADLIFFTGDLVNFRSNEAEQFIQILSDIKAPLGVYSIFGNHDYGHYYSNWKDEGERLASVERIKEIYSELGWKLLLNGNHIISKNDDKIAIVGVENWSAVMRFPKYGNLEKAVKGLDDISFKMLLSHDPSHWKAQVAGKKKDVAVTFSGHTHGMQFGVEIPGLKWSPVQYIYKQWAGLYNYGSQYLYVNRGLGFIGYLGRVGISPEISVFTFV